LSYFVTSFVKCIIPEICGGFAAPPFKRAWMRWDSPGCAGGVALGMRGTNCDAVIRSQLDVIANLEKACSVVSDQTE